MHTKIPLVAGCASKRYNPISVLAVSLILFTSFSLAGAQTNQPPSAVAMALTGQDDGTVNGGRRVWLNAGGSTDPDGDSLSYTWRQTAGTTVTIYDDPSGDAARSYFTAPGATSTTSTLTFEVTVNDDTTTSTASIDVVVRAAAGSAPTNVAATPVAGTSSQIEVTWTAVIGAQAYWVQYKSGMQVYDGVLRNYEVSAPATSQILYGLNASTLYNIRVIAINNAGFASAPSSEVSATTSARQSGITEDPPGWVSWLQLHEDPVALYPDGVRLRWEFVSDDADAYYIQWKSGTQDWDAASREVIIVAKTNTDALRGSVCEAFRSRCFGLIDNLDPETEYTFRVMAVKGTVVNTDQFTPTSERGRPSPAFVATTLPFGPGPTNVMATAGATYIQWTWDAVTNATAYALQWRKSVDQDYSSAGLNPTDATRESYIITGLTAETEYTLRIRAWSRDDGTTERSDWVAVTVTTTAVDANVVEPPGGGRWPEALRVELGIGTDRIPIAWHHAPNADGYIVQWRRDDDQQFSDTERNAVIDCVDCINNDAERSFLITGLRSGTRYAIRVIPTRTGALNGQPSPVSTVTTELDILRGLRTWVEAGTVGQLTVSWNEVLGAAFYRVQWLLAEESFDQEPPVYEEIIVGPDMPLRTSNPQIRRFSTIIDTGNPGGVRYKVRVSAETSTGKNSGWAGPQEFIIIPRDLPPDDARAPSEPRNLSLTTGNGWIQASWDPPDDLGHPPLQAYYVVYREAEARTSRWSANLSKTQFTIRGLTNGQEYVVGVLAGNAFGLGPEAGPLSATPQATGPSEPPSEPQRPPTKPRNLSLVPGDSQIEVSWDEPSDRGEPDFRSYFVEYREVGTRQWLVVGEYFNTDATIEYLDNSATYEVRVTVLNIHGESVAGPKQVTLPSPGGPMDPDPDPDPVPDGPRPPSKPRNLSLVPGDGQIEVSWDEPSDRGDPDFGGYIVEFREVGFEQISNWLGFGFYQPDTTDGWLAVGEYYDTAATIEWLENDVTYEVLVTVLNIHGDAVAGPKRATPSAE